MPMFEDWQTKARKEAAISTCAHEPLITRTNEGITIKSLYTSEDIRDLKHLNSYPGFPPFVRGPYPTMYKIRPWTIRQYAGFSTAHESNAFYRRNLAAGQKGLSIAFDLATHRGYDSDNPRVVGDVGKAGVAIDTVEDMKILFDQIPLDKMSVSMTMNGAVLPAIAFYIIAAEEQGVAPTALAGTIQNDILKEYLCRNTYIYPPAPSMRIVADIIAWCSAKMPKFNTISISGYHMSETGADCVQQVAFTLANGIEYINAALAAGLKIDDFAPRLSFFFGIGMDIFMNVAMLRAARILWSEIVAGFGAQNLKSLALRMHCQTSGWSLTEQDPYNNIVRTTVEALGAALGGTQSLHTNAYDEAIGLPTDFSARIARNTQIILQEESGICRTIDPLAGSYYVESLTDQIARKARAIIADIEKSGGMACAISAGVPKRMIEECAARIQARIDTGKQVIVGLNKYCIENDTSTPFMEVDNTRVRDEQITRLQNIRNTRNNDAVRVALENLAVAAAASDNLLEATLQAARCRATVGEISDALERVFGRYELSPECVSGILANEFTNDPATAEMFKQLQGDIRRFEARTSHAPSILIAKMGQDGHDRGAKVIASAYSDLGFNVKMSPMFSTPEEICALALEYNVHVIGVSSLAAGHKSLIPQLITALRMYHRSDIHIVVGGVIPPQDYPFLFEQGVAAIYGPGSSIIHCVSEVFSLINDTSS